METIKIFTNKVYTEQRKRLNHIVNSARTLQRERVNVIKAFEDIQTANSNLEVLLNKMFPQMSGSSSDRMNNANDSPPGEIEENKANMKNGESKSEDEKHHPNS